MKRVAIIGLFAGIFALALAVIYGMRGQSRPKLEENVAIIEQKSVSDSVHSYTAADVQSGCSAEDKIFCAVEQAVKCTLSPELDGCVKEKVPSFILGRPDVTERPTEMSFSITKIKPIAGSSEVYVYTKSACNAVWFGLCTGTVVYSLAIVNGEWVVTNVYALES